MSPSASAVPPGQGGREDGAAEGRVEHAGSEEVRRAAHHHRHPALPVRLEVRRVQVGAHPALGAHRPPRRLLGHQRPAGRPVRVERVEHDQPRARRRGRGQHRSLHPGHHLDLLLVGHVRAVVHDRGAGQRGGGLPGVGEVGGDPLGARHGGLAAPADHADPAAPAHQMRGEGGAGRPGTQDDVQFP
jgi:hypothetical protein